jgi:2-hydroxychromene-2-carboxylate isomerase
MTREIEFYFDVVSPAAYIAHRRLPSIAERIGATVQYRPILLGGVFQTSGNPGPLTVPAKLRYNRMDFERTARHYGIPLVMGEHFPVNSLALMRGAIVAEEEGFLEAYLDAVYRAIFAEGLNMSDPQVVSAALDTASGVDAVRVADRIQEPAVKDALKRRTEAAVERGVFGAPTFFVGDEMFFGQDRLDLLAEMVGGR